MPELPEVETTRSGLEPHLVGQTIVRLIVRDYRLRWPVDKSIPKALEGQKIVAVERRAKYLVIRTTQGALLWHLGMSGNLRVVPRDLPAVAHDHIDLVLSSGQSVRFHDPRRFGSFFYVTGDPNLHPRLIDLAPEPFVAKFNAQYLFKASRKRVIPIKQLIMNGQVVTGVGNIYASEVLFKSGISPLRPANRITQDEAKRLVASIRAVLKRAIKAGGTTLQDYVNAEGNPGYFAQKLFVYGRAGEPCRVCKTPILSFTQGARTTFYCPTCQK